MTLSAQGAAILRQISTAPRGWLTVAVLARSFQRPETSPAVTGASVSRTLRRLQRSGLIEVANGWGTTLTERLATIAADLARDAETVFQEELAAIRAGAPRFFPFQTAADHLAYRQRLAASQRRFFRVEYVSLTDAGRQHVSERLTASRRDVNRGGPDGTSV